MNKYSPWKKIATGWRHYNCSCLFSSGKKVMLQTSLIFYSHRGLRRNPKESPRHYWKSSIIATVFWSRPYLPLASCYIGRALVYDIRHFKSHFTSLSLPPNSCLHTCERWMKLEELLRKWKDTGTGQTAIPCVKDILLGNWGSKTHYNNLLY